MPRPHLSGALFALLSAWSLWIAVASVAGPGRATARALGFAATAALLAWHRTPRRSAPPRALLAAFAAGFASLPLWSALAIAAAPWLPGGLGAPLPAPLLEPAELVSRLAAAPLAEELLYRERLFGALAARLPTGLALALSSAAFAAPHLDARLVLPVFGLGLALGALYWRSGSLALCVAFHVGLNGAALLGGAPPARAALPLPLAALATLACLRLALGSARNAGGWRG